ncbi:MAG: hypothetical protein PHQ65_13885 [Bacteroidales bacterium]|nr:hypothetical protein [Bacteroidales bacterium]MDD3666350.1 hypothetical protein [Bacteroidales bacterium]
MSIEYKKVSIEWLTRPTGDPFADAGGFVIEYLMKEHPQKDIMELIEYVTKDIYIGAWKGKLHSYYHGSKITNTSIKTDEERINGTLKLFRGILDESESSDFGFCRISGIETKLYSLGRESLMLAGSGGFINFHHSFDEGLKMSKEIAIRMFFVPLATILLQGKIMLLHGSNEKVTKIFVQRNCKANVDRIGKITDAEDIGALKSDFTLIPNALFDFIDHLVITTPNISQDISLSLYHCSNFITKSELQIYKVPAKVFRFYSTCLQPRFKDDWLSFVRSHYSNKILKNFHYNSLTEQFESSEVNTNDVIRKDEYKHLNNTILSKLLNNENIRKNFLFWIRKHSFNFDIVSIYQQNIIGMKKETIIKIKELASFLVREENADTIKRRIKSLDGIKNASGLRRFILKDIISANYTDGNESPIISLEEYVNYLFPDGSYWAEIRDLLLIAIYQELHERELIDDELKIELTVEQENENNFD